MTLAVAEVLSPNKPTCINLVLDQFWNEQIHDAYVGQLAPDWLSFLVP